MKWDTHLTTCYVISSLWCFYLISCAVFCQRFSFYMLHLCCHLHGLKVSFFNKPLYRVENNIKVCMSPFPPYLWNCNPPLRVPDTMTIKNKYQLRGENTQADIKRTENYRKTKQYRWNTKKDMLSFTIVCTYFVTWHYKVWPRELYLPLWLFVLLSELTNNTADARHQFITASMYLVMP